MVALGSRCSNGLRLSRNAVCELCYTHLGLWNYETTDDSRNLWWVGLLVFGEGWHNNHHAFQRMAAHGHKWWEFDMTYWVILAMERLGLVWNVVHTPRGVGQTASSKSDKVAVKSA